MADTIGTRINQLMGKNETQQQLADAIGVSRELVKAWIRGSRRVQIDDLVKLAEHFDVTTDYLLGIAGPPKQTPTLRAAVEYTGLSEKAVLTIANATGSYARIDETLSEGDRARLDDLQAFNVFLNGSEAEVLDDLICYDYSHFLSALVEVRRMVGVVEEAVDAWKHRDPDKPPFTWREATEIQKKLRFALFELSEEAVSTAKDLYCNEALKGIEDIAKEILSSQTFINESAKWED